MKPWDPILDYWFGDGTSTRAFWWTRSDATDDDIRTRFGEHLARARRGELDHWADTARGRLGLIVVMDQFSRNLYRDSGEAFALDHRAQALVTDGIERGMDRELPLLERWFFYMPLQHAEDIALQDLSLRMFEQLVSDAPDDRCELLTGAVEYAHRHRDVIVKFGRFPHRNEVLGRASTDAEIAHLATGKRF